MRERLRDERGLWERTLESEQQDLPEPVLETCARAVAEVVNTVDRLKEKRSVVLTLQNELSTLQSEINVILIEIQAAISERRRSVLEISSPPLWNIASQGGKASLVLAHIRETAEKYVLDLRAYADDESRVIVAHAAVALFLLVLITVLRRPTKVAAENDATLSTIAQLLNRPVAAALLVSIISGLWMHSRSPTAVDTVLTAVLVLAAPRLLPPVISENRRRGPSLLLANYVLYAVGLFVPDGTMPFRLLLLALNGLALWSIQWFLKRFPFSNRRWAPLERRNPVRRAPPPDRSCGRPFGECRW